MQSNKNKNSVPLLEFASNCNIGYSHMFIYIHAYPLLLINYNLTYDLHLYDERKTYQLDCLQIKIHMTS